MAKSHTKKWKKHAKKMVKWNKNSGGKQTKHLAAGRYLFL